METNASDYALAAILSIMTKDNEIYPIAFHSRTFSALELNYDVHDKELLTIFEAFKIWRHYLERSALPINVVTDYKNLEYFLTTKILMRQQARWLEYLCQDLVVQHRIPLWAWPQFWLCLPVLCLVGNKGLLNSGDRFFRREERD